MKLLVALLAISVLSACGSDKTSAKLRDSSGYELTGSYTMLTCSFDYPEQLTLTDTEISLNYSNHGETRSFPYETNYGYGTLQDIQMNETDGYCDIDYSTVCSVSYQSIVVSSTFDSSTGILGFGNCNYQHD